MSLLLVFLFQKTIRLGHSVIERFHDLVVVLQDSRNVIFVCSEPVCVIQVTSTDKMMELPAFNCVLEPEQVDELVLPVPDSEPKRTEQVALAFLDGTVVPSCRNRQDEVVSSIFVLARLLQSSVDLIEMYPAVICESSVLEFPVVCTFLHLVLLSYELSSRPVVEFGSYFVPVPNTSS